MIKQTWNISDEEKSRILNLHESATKNLYLVNEQSGKKSWRLCGYDIFEENGKYFTIDNNKKSIEIPKLSEVQGVIENRKLKLNQVTENGIYLGDEFNMTTQCGNKKPLGYYGFDKLFVYFDDIDTNTPYFGILGWTGKVRSGQGDFIGMKIPKDKDGVIVKFKKSRSKSFILEVSPAMPGRLTVETPIEPVKPEPSFEKIDLNLQSPFVFDSVNLTPEAESEFVDFMKKLKRDYNGMKGDVAIITTASIDGDPEKEITGGFVGCSGKRKRKDYDLCLSTARAQNILKRLKAESGVTSLNFVPVGRGQTKEYGPSWPEAKTTQETAPNRRLMIKLPTITREKK